MTDTIAPRPAAGCTHRRYPRSQWTRTEPRHHGPTNHMEVSHAQHPAIPVRRAGRRQSVARGVRGRGTRSFQPADGKTAVAVGSSPPVDERGELARSAGRQRQNGAGGRCLGHAGPQRQRHLVPAEHDRVDPRQCLHVVAGRDHQPGGLHRHPLHRPEHLRRRHGVAGAVRRRPRCGRIRPRHVRRIGQGGHAVGMAARPLVRRRDGRVGASRDQRSRPHAPGAHAGDDPHLQGRMLGRESVPADLRGPPVHRARRR